MLRSSARTASIRGTGGMREDQRTCPQQEGRELTARAVGRRPTDEASAPTHIVDLAHVAGADTPVEHDVLEAGPDHASGDDGLADGEKVWAETTFSNGRLVSASGLSEPWEEHREASQPNGNSRAYR